MTPKEEIKKTLSNLERVREVAYGDFKRIREILATHELVPIDDSPFDPERCGWTRRGHLYENKDAGVNLYKFEADQMEIRWTGYADSVLVPWPANHSDGVRLLQLLGLEVTT